MRFARLALLALLSHRALLAAAGAQQPRDTARYVVLFSGRPAGFYLEWYSDTALRSFYEYNDRGQPHLPPVALSDAHSSDIAPRVAHPN